MAATLRAQAQAIKDHPPVIGEDFYPPTVLRPLRPRTPVTPGPLAGDTIWYEDPVRKHQHAELVRAGMERIRQEGKRIGRPSVIEREGFVQRFAAVVERLGQGLVSRRQAAQELGIGYATLKRLIDARLRAVQDDAMSSEAPEQIRAADMTLAGVPG